MLETKLAMYLTKSPKITHLQKRERSGLFWGRVRLRRIIILKCLQSQRRGETGWAVAATLCPEGHASMPFVSANLFDPHASQNEINSVRCFPFLSKIKTLLKLVNIVKANYPISTLVQNVL